MNEHTAYCVITITKDDLRGIGVKSGVVDKLTNMEMRRLAAHMAQSYLESGFWNDLDLALDHVIKKDKA